MKPAAAWVPEIVREATSLDASRMAALVKRIQRDVKVDEQSVQGRVLTLLEDGPLKAWDLFAALGKQTTRRTFSATLSQMRMAGMITKAGECRWQLNTP